MPECPKCGASLATEEERCAACGSLPGEATASFEPIQGGDVGTTPGPDAIEGPVLIVRKGPQPGERFYLDRPALSVGRDPKSDIFLNDMTVSRTHARLSLAGTEVTVNDAGSLNGTYVNGVCVDEALLVDGDVLQIGTFQMVFHQGGTQR